MGQSVKTVSSLRTPFLEASKFVELLLGNTPLDNLGKKERVVIPVGIDLYPLLQLASAALLGPS
jgi:hypothetical protein